ncbi:MAG: hypothetical protein L6Q98_07545 [Anaerolineae bacterium]|nr:hypothetical protein [Anaerolineae bacterium]NUQ04641.1 hypothetical protein [Anaerolineae bacterium]
MSRRTVVRMIAFMAAIMILWVAIPTTFAAGETFKVISVDAVGCSSGQFGMTVERANLDGGTYTVNTVVTVEGLVYMNEAASISINGFSGWHIFDNFTYGPVPNPGTYPIPSGKEMRLDFSLERPIGTVLYEWTLIVDGCDTGNILYNGPTPTGSACNLAVPSSAVVGEAPLGAQVYYAPGEIAPDIVLNPGTYLVIGQDSSETYYQVVLACQKVWVRKDTMQPSYQAPQNGAPLPTGIVG